MRLSLAGAALFSLASGWSLISATELPLNETQQRFRAEVAAKTAALDQQNRGALAGGESWLFLANELRFLARGRFWGDAAASASRSQKAEAADPIPAILDFHRQLQERGIALLVVPVPAKAAVYPDKLGLLTTVAPEEAAPYLQEFYQELRSHGIHVLDLSPIFAREREHPRGSVYCRTDSHWSGIGCVLAAEAITEQIRAKLPAPTAAKDYAVEWKDVSVTGDLAGLVEAGQGKPAAEKIAIRAVSDPANGGAVQPDASSPLLVLGDSHTLVFREFLAERAGLVDQLAEELGFAPDLIGTRGSGATAVRISLYRRTRTDAAYLAKKKAVVWCFAAREFTEADQGWVAQPVAK